MIYEGTKYVFTPADNSRIQLTAETQSGLPLLPWSCYASVIQCDIIQYLLFLFYYNTGIPYCVQYFVSVRDYMLKNTVFNMLQV